MLHPTKFFYLGTAICSVLNAPTAAFAAKVPANYAEKCPKSIHVKITGFKMKDSLDRLSESPRSEVTTKSVYGVSPDAVKKLRVHLDDQYSYFAALKLKSTSAAQCIYRDQYGSNDPAAELIRSGAQRSLRVHIMPIPLFSDVHASFTVPVQAKKKMILAKDLPTQGPIYSNEEGDYRQIGPLGSWDKVSISLK